MVESEQPGNSGENTVEFNVVPQRPKTEIIDYDTKRGSNHFKDTTAKLHDALQDCDPDGFYQFMKHLKIRASTFGWLDDKGILRIPPNSAKPDVTKSLLDDYGTITYEAILAKELTYIDTNCRATQDTRSR